MSMSPPSVPQNDSPRAWGRGRPRGPPPFMLQLLRAPLTVNNIIALIITKSVQHHRKLLAPEEEHPGKSPCGGARRTAHVFGLLGFLFIFSTIHNVLTVMRFHRIRRATFGESTCAARRRWRRGDMTEEERAECGQKLREMGRKMPSLWISSADVILAVAFLGMWMLTTMVGLKEGKVELGVGYASVGALVAFVLNLIVGVNGLKMWARAKREQKETLAQVEEAAKDDKYVDEKGPLLAN